jgi:hypothetical protein
MTIRIAMLLAFAAAACTANDDVPAPAVAGVIPDHAGPGAVVVVNGSYFCQQTMPDQGEVDPLACANMGIVQFGSQPGIVQQYTDTSIMVAVPQAALGATQLSVSVAGRVSNTVDFTIE